MIIEKLMRQADFTDVEKSIADYLLQNGYEVKNMSISDLAKRTYSSPATITRFCRKLDLDGYKKFQILFNSEYDAFAMESAVDANYPFSGNDSFEQIARKLAKLNSDTISKTISGFDYNQFRRIVRRISQSDMVNIFSVGTSATVAMDFQQKMLRFGHIVNLSLSSCFLPGYALAGTERTVNLVISQSGENRDVVESLRLLKKRKAYCVGITATPDSTVARMCQEVILVELEEDRSYTAKIDTFAVYSAFHFVLDCLFSFLYKMDYEENEKLTREKASIIYEENEKLIKKNPDFISSEKR